jgi:ATP/maltotriose-dependent transcriptional regulator MalT
VSTTHTALNLFFFCVRNVCLSVLLVDENQVPISLISQTPQLTIVEAFSVNSAN